MANLLNNQFNNLRLEIDESEYWDFFINKDSNIVDVNFSLLGNDLITKCLSSYIDLSDRECIDGKNILSKKDYTWEKSINASSILYNIGYTGVDNGLIWLKKDEIDNSKFIEIYQNSEHEIPSDNALRLYPIDGSSKKYEYPIEIESNRAKLTGGFFQGFFETECDKYQILPDRLENGEYWDLEFILERKSFNESDKTINTKYPQNKGIFFYIGTRAENKWDYLYNDPNDDAGDSSYFSEYGDGDLITKECLGIFSDPNPVMPVEWESESLDEYLSFKYYDEDDYDLNDHGLEDYFFETHKANTIDEDKANNIISCWCKNGCTETKKTIRKKVSHGCNCGKIKNYTITETEIIESNCDGYLSKCETFDLLDDLDTIDNNDLDYLEPDLDISDFLFKTKNDFDLKINNQWFFETDNKFLLFDRTCNGFLTSNYNVGDIVRYTGVKYKYSKNPFLLFDRTCTGYTTSNIKNDEVYEKYDVNADLYQNAFALRITENGAIGYRYLIQDCDSEEGYTIKENYSSEGVIKENEVSVIHVRIKGYNTTMSLDFYVNGKLVFLTKEMPKFNLRKLNDLYEKQEGVPFNISLGGGTQGLMETVLPNYMQEPYRVYPLEKHFAGTFIGYLYGFRFYNCGLNFFEILNNYLYEIKKQ